MSRLFRILRAADKEIDLFKITSKLEVIGKDIGFLDLAPVTRTSENVLKIGDRTAVSLIESLRSGNVEEALKHIYKVENVPNSVKLKFLDEVKDLPSSHIGLATAKAEKIKAKLKMVDNEIGDGVGLSAPDGPELTVDMVNKSPTLSKTVNIMKNIKVVSLYAGVVLIGGTTALVVAVINNHRREIRGCYRFTNTNGTIHSCKMAESSCVDGQQDLHETTRACFPAAPTIIGATTCAGIKGVGCINCPPTATTAATDESDMVSYRCNNPSVMDAMADLLNEKADAISEIVGEVGGAVSGVFSGLFTILKYLFIIMGVVFGVLLIAYGVKRFAIISNYGK